MFLSYIHGPSVFTCGDNVPDLPSLPSASILKLWKDSPEVVATTDDVEPSPKSWGITPGQGIPDCAGYSGHVAMYSAVFDMYQRGSYVRGTGCVSGTAVMVGNCAVCEVPCVALISVSSSCFDSVF